MQQTFIKIYTSQFQNIMVNLTATLNMKFDQLWLQVVVKEMYHTNITNSTLY